VRGRSGVLLITLSRFLFFHLIRIKAFVANDTFLKEGKQGYRYLFLIFIFSQHLNEETG